MTDTEQKRIKAICKVAQIDDISDLSDGYHTFGQLYYQRMILFAALVKQNRDKAWKSLRHEDGELCFGGGWFIVGIDTPEGSYTYHYENKYFDLFDCEILDYGKHWDGHTEKDVTRLLSLEREGYKDCISRQAAQAKIKNICDEYRLSYEDGERKAATGGSAYALGHAFDDLPPVTQQQKKIWVVTYWDKGEEPIVTVFNNRKAAEYCYKAFKDSHVECCIDETMLYHSFTIVS